MALSIELKPKEKMIIGGAVIQNGEGKARFLIENPVPLLRQRDILTEEKANSPAKRIYFTIQLMYIDEENLARYHRQYWNFVQAWVKVSPSTLGLVDQMNEAVLLRRYYAALKLAKKLVHHEKEAIRRVQESL